MTGKTLSLYNHRFRPYATPSPVLQGPLQRRPTSKTIARMQKLLSARSSISSHWSSLFCYSPLEATPEQSSKAFHLHQEYDRTDMILLSCNSLDRSEYTAAPSYLLRSCLPGRDLIYPFPFQGLPSESMSQLILEEVQVLLSVME